jgi:hypothetical protein
MATITIPEIPADWISHTGIIPAGNGYRTRVKKVLHKTDGFHPFVIHTAYEYQGRWAYERGSYFHDLTEASKAFEAV